MAERVQALAPVHARSTEEVRQCLLFDGKSIENHAPPVTPEMTAELEEPSEEEWRMAESDVIVPRARKPRKTQKRNPVRKIPIEALLEKSRQAYSSGRLEEARRYYSLVKRADPNSAEAAEKLELIRKELE